MLKRAGRRKITERATVILAALRSERLGQPPAVTAAYAVTVRSLIAVITTLNHEVKNLQGQVEADFGRHPDAEIYRSQPGVGAVLGARVLGEFGDDPHRYADGKARRNYAGTSPLTRALGKKKVVAARFIGNSRLVDALNAQAFSALNASPGARALYDELRARGTEHNDARPPAAREQPRRHPARMPQDPHPLRRVHRLGTPAKPPSIFRRGLTLKLLGCIPCWACKMCDSGRENLCENLQFFGCGYPRGGMADHFTLPADRLYPVPDALDDRTAALIEPLATPVHAVRLAGDVTGRTVAVLGAGTIGLSTLAVRYCRRAMTALPLASDSGTAVGAGGTRFDVTLGPTSRQFAFRVQ